MRLYTEKQIRSRIEAAVADAVAPLLKRIAKLEEENARLKKNSSNSSKPPSSDIVKPPKGTGKSPKGKKKRKRGGQHGHPRHERKAFSPEDVTVDRRSRPPPLTGPRPPFKWPAVHGSPLQRRSPKDRPRCRLCSGSGSSSEAATRPITMPPLRFVGALFADFLNCRSALHSAPSNGAMSLCHPNVFRLVNRSL